MFKVVLKYEDIDYEYDIELSREDYVEYEYEKRIGRPFNLTSYFLDDNGIKTYNEIEDKWYHNEVDERKLLADEKFILFLKDKYREEAFNEYYKEQEEEEFIPLDIDELAEIFADNWN